MTVCNSKKGTEMTPAVKKYLRDFGLAMALYTITVLGLIPFGNDPAHPAYVRILIALSPMVPALLALRAVLVFHRASDELYQKINGEAVIIAFLVTGLLTFAYGFLENVGFPRLPIILILPISIAVWGLATPFVIRRYR